jgi:hypothetical protein
MKKVLLLLCIAMIISGMTSCVNKNNENKINSKEPEKIEDNTIEADESTTEIDLMLEIAGIYERNETIVYSNTNYGFDVILPASWEGYSVIEDIWGGYYSNLVEDLGYVIINGPKIYIRHPLWTEENPWQDIHIEIYTLNQWPDVEEEILITAPAVRPNELARNSQYVFALTGRYNFAFGTGWEEVQFIISNRAIRATENILLNRIKKYINENPLDTEIWQYMASDEKYLPCISAIPEKDIYLYSCENGNVLLKYQDKYEMIYLKWGYTTPRLILPEMYLYDYDGDGIDELAIKIYQASGTGVSLWSLLMVEVNEEVQQYDDIFYRFKHTMLDYKKIYEMIFAHVEKTEAYMDNDKYVLDIYLDGVNYNVDITAQIKEVYGSDAVFTNLILNFINEIDIKNGIVISLPIGCISDKGVVAQYKYENESVYAKFIYNNGVFKVGKTWIAIFDTITDINDWGKLGFRLEDDRYKYILAFLNKDTATLEKYAFVQEGTYDIYKTLEFGEYIIKLSAIWEDYVDFNIDIISSGVECLPVGNYTFVVGPGVMGTDFRNLSDIYNREYTAAQGKILRWLGNSIDYMYNDYAGLSGELRAQYDIAIMYYVMSFAELEEGLTLEKVQERVKHYFGIDNFIPPENFKNPPYYDQEKDGLYYMQGYGGQVWTFEFTGETVKDGITTITIQFFADSAKTVKSHAIEYIIQAVDDHYRFISSKIIYESPYKPYHYTG